MRITGADIRSLNMVEARGIRLSSRDINSHRSSIPGISSLHGSLDISNHRSSRDIRSHLSSTRVTLPVRRDNNIWPEP